MDRENDMDRMRVILHRAYEVPPDDDKALEQRWGDLLKGLD